MRAPMTRHEVILPPGAGKIQVTVAASTKIGEGQPSSPITLTPSNTGKG